MLTPPANINDITHAIQLALAPAFLLTSIAGLLNVMTGRLARIIDHGRRITDNPLPQGQPFSDADEIRLLNLDRRRHLASTAITACTLSALLVCTVIAVLFLEALFQVELGWIVGMLFTGSTLALVIGLSYFLREVHLATRTVRILL